MITIITPCYNAEKFIANCILNVAKYYIDGMEHLIIDGASTDGTLSIVSELAQQYKHISVYSKADTGQSQAMNRGINRAKHRTISFLNADDEYCSGTFALIHNLIQNISDSYFIVGNCQLRTLSGDNLTVNKPSNIRFDRLLLLSRRFPYPSNPSAYFYDKHIHDTVGFYAEDLHYTMDLEFVLRLSRFAKIFYVDQILGIFVLHQDGKTHQSSVARAEMKSWSSKYIRELPLYQRKLYKIRRGIEIIHEVWWMLSSIRKRVQGKFKSFCWRLLFT
jgi:glycosyltransferase involved in cell wall biosynthesis